jgi:DNA-binding response OmpR family regulator
VWILVVENEAPMGELLRQGLEEENHAVTLARDGMEGLHAAKTSSFDAIVLDVMMPGMDGFEVARRLRAAGQQVPIIMLTARDSAADIVKGLDAGADDYLTKPFSLTVLLARLRAISRRAAQPSMPTLHVDDLVLDPASREVTRGGQKINLTATEFRVLEFLLRRAGRAASRSSIIEAVWGFEEEIESNTVDAYIKLLRDKIDNKRERKLIQTVRGYGYILREEV